jgi:hypothetical protein
MIVDVCIAVHSGPCDFHMKLHVTKSYGMSIAVLLFAFLKRVKISHLMNTLFVFEYLSVAPTEQ